MGRQILALAQRTTMNPTAFPARGLFFCGLLWLLAALLSPAWAGPKAEEVRGAAEEAVRVRSQTQKLVDEWAAEKAELSDELEALEQDLETLAWQRDKVETYLADQKAKVAELQRRLAELDRIRTELEPLLDQWSERLARFVAQDLPFLKEERAARLEALRQRLDDFDASLAEKARRLLEAVRIETEYGQTVESREAELKIQERLTQVRLLRVGRLGLFALSLDGRRAWRWEPASKTFKPVDDYAREIEAAAEMAAQRRVVELVQLPLASVRNKEAQR